VILPSVNFRMLSSSGSLAACPTISAGFRHGLAW
jgi:hypothetical protein